MDPDFGIGIGRDGGEHTRHKPRPSPFVRGLELAGLGLVAYGLGSLRFWIVAVGGAMIVASYALYRRKHRDALTCGTSAGPGGLDGPGEDGGGDRGGGD